MIHGQDARAAHAGQKVSAKDLAWDALISYSKREFMRALGQFPLMLGMLPLKMLRWQRSQP